MCGPEEAVMAKYVVYDTGVYAGTYVAADSDEAIRFHVEDLGYASVEEAARVLRISSAEYMTLLHVREED